MKQLMIMVMLLLLTSLNVFAVSTIQTRVDIVSNNQTTKISVEGGNDFTFQTGSSIQSTQFLLRDAQQLCGNVTQACDQDISKLVNAFFNQSEKCGSDVQSYKDFILQSANLSLLNNTIQVQLEACQQRLSDIQSNNPSALCESEKQRCIGELQKSNDSKLVWFGAGAVLGALGMWWNNKRKYAQDAGEQYGRR